MPLFSIEFPSEIKVILSIPGLEKFAAEAISLLRSSHMALADLQAAIANLQAKVAANTTVTGSAITLIQGLSQLIKDLQAQIAAGADLTAVTQSVNDLATAVDAADSTLAAAVSASTPAQP